jgi:hypothetical protein
MTIQEALELIKTGGSTAIFIFIAYGLWKKHIVIGWIYDKCEAENKELRALLNTHATRTEARVDMLEQERDKRYVSPA